MIKREEYGTYIEVDGPPDEKRLEETKELFGNYLRDLFIEIGHLIVKGPNENGKYTIGFKAGLDRERPDYEKHDFIPGEIIYSGYDCRAYKVSEEPDSIRERCLKKRKYAILEPTDGEDARLMRISEDIVGTQYFYTLEEAQAMRKRLDETNIVV